MKKVLKIFCISFVFVCLIAFIVCYFIVPTQTKELLEIVIKYLNTPIGIIGGTTITVGLVAFIIIKLIYDRHKNNIKDEIEKVKESHKMAIESSKELLEQANKVNDEVLDSLRAFENKIDYLVESLSKVCETSPNAKINAIGVEIKQHKDDYKEQIKESYNKINEKYFDLGKYKENEKFVELGNVISSLEEKIERLEEHYGKEE